MKVAFPNDGSFAFEFVRNLGFMYYGGSDLGEMIVAAGRRFPRQEARTLLHIVSLNLLIDRFELRRRMLRKPLRFP
jgi:hypothetical protein